MPRPALGGPRVVDEDEYDADVNINKINIIMI